MRTSQSHSFENSLAKKIVKKPTIDFNQRCIHIRTLSYERTSELWKFNSQKRL